MLRSFDDGVVDDVAELPADDPTTEDRTDREDPVLAVAVSTLRGLVLAVERYRAAVSLATGLGVTESQALSYLVARGDHGQSELARALGLTSSAATALVDRLERHDVAERVRHPSDRRRTIIRLTSRGSLLADRTHQPLHASLGQVEPGELAGVTRWLGHIAEGLAAVRPGSGIASTATAAAPAS